MAFSLDEQPDSRQESFEPPSYLLTYLATGEQDNDIVVANALAGTPLSVFRTAGTLFRQNMTVEPVGWAQYRIEVPYGIPQSDPLNLPVGSSSFTFDTTGATVNIKAAREHIASFPPITNEENPHKGAIGVREDGDVQGADIVIPALKLTYNFKHPLGVITETYARTQAAVTGATNLNPFRGFAGGELLYIGASGGDGTDVEATCSYNFIASQNVSNLQIGDITNIVKGGHHYAWIEFKDEVVNGRSARQPRRVHIERVYDPVDFETVLGWS